MAGKVLELLNFLETDALACDISRYQYTWNMLRQDVIGRWKEIREYLYATDTRKTSNSKLPWKNSTTIPKLCQINDNLFANYMSAIFPKRKFMEYESDSQDEDIKAKKDSVTAYMYNATDQRQFKDEIAKCVHDFIQYGNIFAMPEWQDFRVAVPNKKTQVTTKVGYCGPGFRRISPLDIVFNPIAPSFDETPKIVRTIVSLGEVKKLIGKMTDDDNRDVYDKLYTYMRDLRMHASQPGFSGEMASKDEYLNVDGFTNYQQYLESNFCELLWFYGDIYDQESDTFLENHCVVVADRHKILIKKPIPGEFGKSPIYHCGWRRRSDNLWAMGPLENLVGLQYRIDHLENEKADCLDLIAFPPLKIKGYVEDFEWGPMARIVVHDDSDVEMMAPPFQVLQVNTEIQELMNRMEEMAGSPKEAMGFRTPGEKTKFEVQQLQNAASRIFNNKIIQAEEFIEALLNGMLEIGRRKADGEILVKTFDSDYQIESFLTLTPDDIAGTGRIRPYAARHFAEQAQLVQNLTTLSGSPLWQQIAPHFSTIKMARLFEDLMEIQDYKIVMPYIALAEQADSQRIANAQMQQVLMEALTPTGMTQDDSSQPFMPQQQQQGPMQQMPMGTGPTQAPVPTQGQ